MEAAEEAARQLRLRDLGGLIVIDFIDMRDRKHNHDVEKTLKQALKMDKARVNLGRISEFGLLEMSRQRIAKTLNDAIHLACPHCEGRGKVKSVEAMAVSFLRKVHAVAAKGNVSHVHGGLPLDVAYYLLNRKKRELIQIEKDYDIEVTVKGKTSFLLNQLELETVKREKPRPEDMPKQEPAQEVSAAVADALEPAIQIETVVVHENATPAESAKKKKRRRKKKKTTGEATAAAATVGTSESEDSIVNESITDSEEAIAEMATTEEQPPGAEAAAKPKKRKRRRSRKEDKGQDTLTASTEESPEQPVAVDAEQPVEVIMEQPVETAEKSRKPNQNESENRAPRKPKNHCLQKLR